MWYMTYILLHTYTHRVFEVVILSYCKDQNSINMANAKIDDLTYEGELNESNISNGAENLQDSQEETETTLQADEEQREKLVRLPIGRVRNIIKMDPDVNLVNQEAVFLIAKSTVITISIFFPINFTKLIVILLLIKNCIF